MRLITLNNPVDLTEEMLEEIGKNLYWLAPSITNEWQIEAIKILNTLDPDCIVVWPNYFKNEEKFKKFFQRNSYTLNLKNDLEIYNWSEECRELAAEYGSIIFFFERDNIPLNSIFEIAKTLKEKEYFDLSEEFDEEPLNIKYDLSVGFRGILKRNKIILSAIQKNIFDNIYLNTKDDFLICSTIEDTICNAVSLAKNELQKIDRELSFQTIKNLLLLETKQ